MSSVPLDQLFHHKDWTSAWRILRLFRWFFSWNAYPYQNMFDKDVHLWDTRFPLVFSMSNFWFPVSISVCLLFLTHFSMWDWNFVIDSNRFKNLIPFQDVSWCLLILEWCVTRLSENISSFLILNSLCKLLFHSFKLCHFSLQSFYLSLERCNLLFLRYLFLWNRSKSGTTIMGAHSHRRFLTSTIIIILPLIWCTKLLKPTSAPFKVIRILTVI